MPKRRPRLIVLPPSHYCERARWALDHMGTSYTEERWAVGLHVPLARRLANGTTLPILDTGTEIIEGSDRILDWTGMPGGDPALEQRFETRIGPLVRQYLYAAMLGDPRSDIQKVLFDGVPGWQASVGRLAWPVTRSLMIKGMNAHAGLVPKLEQDVAAELDWFENQLDYRRILAGERLGRAEITMASLLAPLARPPECPIYRKATLPAIVEDAPMRWSIRPGLQWVRATYTLHRS